MNLELLALFAGRITGVPLGYLCRMSSGGEAVAHILVSIVPGTIGNTGAVRGMGLFIDTGVSVRPGRISAMAQPIADIVHR